MTLLGGMLNTSVAANESVVKAVLRSALRAEYVCFDLDDGLSTTQSFGTAENCGADEKMGGGCRLLVENAFSRLGVQ